MASRAAYHREYRKRRQAPGYQPRVSLYGEPPRNRQDEKLREKYHISLKEYDALLEKQHGTCYLCQQVEKVVIFGKVLALAVDHDHKTKAVRHLLCYRCNQVIGRLETIPELLDRVIAYLRQPHLL